jgi:hypothetical protein
MNIVRNSWLLPFGATSSTVELTSRTSNNLSAFFKLKKKELTQKSGQPLNSLSLS